MQTDTFERFESKFVIPSNEKEKFLSLIRTRTVPDRFGVSNIKNVYFDTPSHAVIARSLEKPMYKEKLRIRTYGDFSPSGTVFLELKKKYDKRVFKRRISMKEKEALSFLSGDFSPPDGEIVREIVNFTERWRSLSPSIGIFYDREAFFSDDGIRITLDENIEYCDFTGKVHSPENTGKLLYGWVLCEVKTSGAIPLWTLSALEEARFKRISFSKCGEAYKKMMISGGYNGKSFQRSL